MGPVGEKGIQGPKVIFPSKHVSLWKNLEHVTIKQQCCLISHVLVYGQGPVGDIGLMGQKGDNGTTGPKGIKVCHLLFVCQYHIDVQYPIGVLLLFVHAICRR